MGSAPISTPFLTASLLAVVLLELAAAAAGSRFQLPRLWLIAAARSSQMLVVIALAMVQAGGLHVLGLDRNSILPGLRKGLIWSAGFAAAAGLLFLGLFMIGQTPADPDPLATAGRGRQPGPVSSSWGASWPR